MPAPPATIVFETYGVTVELLLEDPPFVAPALLLPPGSRQADPASATGAFVLTAAGEVKLDGRPVGSASADDGSGLAALEAALRAHVALQSPDRIFVHAGVVAVRGRAIVLPGTSYCGKTTLVAALVRAGATYFSDEFAVLDERGAVHPYPKPLRCAATRRGCRPTCSRRIWAARRGRGRRGSS